MAEQRAAPIEGDSLAFNLRDEIIAYGLEVRPAYEGLRSLLGQYAGLLLLAYGNPSANYPDLDLMAAAADRLGETKELLGLLHPPAGAADHHNRLRNVTRLLGQVHMDFSNGLRRGDQKDEAHRRLKIAQALLQSVSDTRFAMTMVDMESSCCCAPRVSSEGL